jgi:hypothetical protein
MHIHDHVLVSGLHFDDTVDMDQPEICMDSRGSAAYTGSTRTHMHTCEYIFPNPEPKPLPRTLTLDPNVWIRVDPRHIPDPRGHVCIRANSDSLTLSLNPYPEP